jgi:hypothetical protein
MLWFAASDRAGEIQTVRLSQLDEAELMQHFRALVQQGPAELARVVESLVAKRPAQQTAAARTLHEEIERCARATAEEAASQLDQIAGAMAKHAWRFDAEALTAAAALADRILAMPRRGANHSDRLRNCHIVLKEEAQRRLKEQARRPDDVSFR